MKHTLVYSAVALAIAPISSALAYEAGDIVIRGGATLVAPDESSDNIMADALGGDTGTGVSVDNNAQLGLTASYFFSPHLAVELLAATPFKHTLSLDNAGSGLGDGDFADIKHLPPVVSALYYVMGSDSPLQPYVGLGLNYTLFYDEQFNADRETQGFDDLSLDDSFGLAAQAGLDFMINENWHVNGSVRYIDLSTEADFTVAGAPGSVEVDIDPWVFTVAAGYRF